MGYGGSGKGRRKQYINELAFAGELFSSLTPKRTQQQPAFNPFGFAQPQQKKSKKSRPQPTFNPFGFAQPTKKKSKKGGKQARNPKELLSLLF